MSEHPPIEEDEVIQADYADPEDVFYLEWARETYKQSPARLLDSLQRVITLATALLGGTMFVVASQTVPDWCRVPAMFLFLLALSIAFYGTLPYSEAVAISDPNQVRTFKAKVARFRSDSLWYATVSLWMGLLVGTVGGMLRAVNLA